MYLAAVFQLSIDTIRQLVLQCHI